MLAYNYQINFSSIKKWLPQTTEKIIYYLEHLCESRQPDKSTPHPLMIGASQLAGVNTHSTTSPGMSSVPYASMPTSQSAELSMDILADIDPSKESAKDKRKKKLAATLQDLATDKHNNHFDINKTRWELCLKPKNSRGAQQLEKVIQKSQLEEPDFDEFRKLLEISHLVEIYIKAIFDKIAYRSKSITYLSYKNQHDYAHHKQASISQAVKKEVEQQVQASMPKNIKMNFECFDLVYAQTKNGKIEEKTILQAQTFRFEQDEALYVIGFHHKEDVEFKTYTLYQIDEADKTIRIKYYLDSKTASEILAIKDLQSHDIAGKKVKIFVGKISSLQMI